MQLAAPTVTLRRYGAGEAVDVHDFHQIVFGVDGAMEMDVDGVGAKIDAGSAWLIPAGARHAYAGLGDNRQLVLDLPCSSLAVPERLFATARVVSLDAPLSALVANTARQAASHAPPGAHVAGGSDARRFDWLTAARLCEALLATGQHSGGTMAGLAFASIDRWLRERLAEPLRIADLAAHCGLSPRRLHTLFKEAFGETPHQYLNKLRLDSALLLLDAAPRPLAEIAAQTGFADQSAFTRAFTRRFGQAPGQWRAARLRVPSPGHASFN